MCAGGRWHLPLLSGATGLKTGSCVLVEKASQGGGAGLGAGHCHNSAECRASLRLGVTGPGLLLCALLLPGGWCALENRARDLCVVGGCNVGVASTFAGPQVLSGTVRLLIYRLVLAVLKAHREEPVISGAQAQPFIAPQNA